MRSNFVQLHVGILNFASSVQTTNLAEPVTLSPKAIAAILVLRNLIGRAEHRSTLLSCKESTDKTVEA